MTYISYDSYRSLREVLADRYPLADVRVEIDRVYPFDNYDGQIRFSVNWSCKGTQSTKEASAFIHDLANATALADFLNSQKFYIDWSEPITIGNPYLAYEFWEDEIQKYESLLDSDEVRATIETLRK